MTAINFKFISYNVKGYDQVFPKIRKTLFGGHFESYFPKYGKMRNFLKICACQFLTIINCYLDAKNQKKMGGF